MMFGVNASFYKSINKVLASKEFSNSDINLEKKNKKIKYTEKKWCDRFIKKNKKY